MGNCKLKNCLTCLYFLENRGSYTEYYCCYAPKPKVLDRVRIDIPCGLYQEK